MISLHFSTAFKKLLPLQSYEFEADSLTQVYRWIQTHLPVLTPVLFDSAQASPKPFVCILCNNVQLNLSDSALKFSPGDQLEVILPMSGG